MKRLLRSVAIGLSCFGSTANLTAQFTNLNFQSSSAIAMPGWTVSGSIFGGYEVPMILRGPVIGVYIDGDGGTWTAGQGTYISMQRGAGIAQTGYLSPSARSLRFRGGLLSSLVVSFAGENLSCVVVSSNYECAADISKFAGTTGELKFVSPVYLAYLDSIRFSEQSVSNVPPTIAISETSDSRVRLTFPAQLGTIYFIEASANLLNWEMVGSIQATNDPADFFDNPASSYETRYYRVVVPP